jgi:TetR/AcrR family transcriptional repressor of mexJK operon
MAIAVEPGSSATAEDVSGRGRIMREGRVLFTAHGFAAVSMQQIADAAAVNKATLYHHFRDKEDLFVSVMRDELARSAAGLSASLAGGGTLREQLERAASHILAARRSDFGRLMGDLHAHVAPERRAALMERCAPPWEQLERVIQHAMDMGEIREIDAGLVARAFFAMVGSQVWWAKFGDGRSEPDDQFAATMTGILLEGIAADR